MLRPGPRIAMPPCCSAPAAFLLLLLVLAVQPAPSAAVRHPSTTAPTTAFGRSSWLGNLTLLGSASMLPGQVAFSLTSNASDGVRAGRALFSEPVRLLLPPPNPRAARAQASFSTRFTFRILPFPTYGDGLAFIFTSSRTFVGAADGFLGLFASTITSNSGDLAQVNTVAVEFDTYRDLALHDPDGNHLALDAGSIYSAASASPGLDLKAGGVPITAWVQYDAPRRRLRAWVSYSTSRRHVNPALSIPIDLAGLLNDSMYVGFSASNNNGSALHIINSWSFRTYWPRNTSFGPLASPPPPPTPVPSLPAHHHHRQPSIVAWVVSTLIILAIVAIFCSPWIRSHRKTQHLALQLADLSEKCNILSKDVARSA